ncbi:hypothetical protein QTH90_30595 [Variovorax sp. J2P1-59]|uniref:hypothetical protein n=1 Tax=Variovorax flavidus TaxID=3053501 RepID=UPI002574D583|nr:hypothetical protein [Variovorax sp. J2P1-59]MDM0078790.1 hypothetical protein [Variovorax sp. J2P1-59]
MKRLVLANSIAAILATFALVGCGGGGGGGEGGAVPAKTTTTESGAVQESPTTAKSPVPTEAAGAGVTLTLTDCARITGNPVPSPAITGADMQEVNDVLLSQDAAHSYDLFKRSPADVMWSVRSSGRAVTLGTLGTGVHETNHVIDFALSSICSGDRYSRFLLDGQVHLTGTRMGDTENRVIVDSTYPAALKVSRSVRFGAYITESAGNSRNDFSSLLEELNAHAGAAALEAAVRSNPEMAYLYQENVMSDENIGGMVDFMLFMQHYLLAAKSSSPLTYSAIQGQPDTLAFMQVLWTRAESVLVRAYPHSTIATGKGGTVVPADVFAEIYSPQMLSELDALGITHKVAADWVGTYLH